MFDDEDDYNVKKKEKDRFVQLENQVNAHVLLFAEMMFTRRMLLTGTPSIVARFATRFGPKNVEGVAAGRPNVRTINSDIFKSITVTPSIKNIAICVVLNH